MTEFLKQQFFLVNRLRSFVMCFNEANITIANNIKTAEYYSIILHVRRLPENYQKSFVIIFFGSVFFLHYLDLFISVKSNLDIVKYKIILAY